MGFDDHVKKWGAIITFITGAAVIVGFIFRYLIWPALPVASKDAQAATQRRVEVIETRDQIFKEEVVPRIEKKIDTLGTRMDIAIDTWNRHIELEHSNPTKRRTP